MNATANSLPETATGPKGLPLLGCMPELRKDPLAFFSRVAREFGDVVRLDLIEQVHLLKHPDHVKHVLQDNHLNYEKGFGYVRMEPLVGKGLLTSEGDFWKRQRRLAQPAFHRQRIAGFAALMARHTLSMFDRWNALPAQSPIDAHAEMTRLTLGVVGDALFSVNLIGEAEATGRALSTALEIINDRFQQFFVTPRAIPTPENLRLYGAIEVLEGVVNGIIEQRRAQPGGQGDLLEMFMEIQDADTGERMTDRQLRDEVMTMVLAGHETTANALSWTWFLLSKHPEIERKLYEEVSRVLEGRVPTVEDLPRLEYATRVINEAMRLYPPAWFTSRKAIKEDRVGGVRIPAGSTVLLLPYLLHRDPRFWDNPEGFDPDRFGPEASAARPRLAFFPFSAGPRMCIGNSFAVMEMQLVLAMVVQRYRLDLVPGARVEPDPQVTLRPKEGVPVVLRRRN